MQVEEQWIKNDCFDFIAMTLLSMSTCTDLWNGPGILLVRLTANNTLHIFTVKSHEDLLRLRAVVFQVSTSP